MASITCLTKRCLLHAACSYCQALQEHPSAPAEVRLGIAACHHKLGSTTTAGQAYERVLELDPGNADAMLGLASIKFNSSNVQQVGCAAGSCTTV